MRSKPVGPGQSANQRSKSGAKEGLAPGERARNKPAKQQDIETSNSIDSHPMIGPSITQAHKPSARAGADEQPGELTGHSSSDMGPTDDFPTDGEEAARYGE